MAANDAKKFKEARKKMLDGHLQEAHDIVKSLTEVHMCTYTHAHTHRHGRKRMMLSIPSHRYTYQCV